MKYRLKLKKPFFGFSTLGEKIVEIQFKGIGTRESIIEELELLKKEVEKF